jgi:pentatricopeptide repeat protein
MKAKDSNGAIPVDVVSYNTVMKGYARQHKLQDCFDLIAAMHATGIESDEVTYSTILDTCISEGQFDKATEVIDSFIASGCVMNTVLYTTFMKGFVRMDMLEKAMALYRQMKQVSASGPGADGAEPPRPDVILYSVLIKANCDLRQLEPALHLAKDMIESGLQPDDIIVNRLLDGCRHTSDGDLADSLFKEFIESGKVQPSLPTLATMVKIYGKCNRVEEAARLVQTAYDRYGLRPSVVLYTCLMSACTRNRRLDLACEIFDAMVKARIEPDAMTYSTLFKACSTERDLERAVHIARVAASNKSQSYSFPAEEIQNVISQWNGPLGKDVIHIEVLRAIVRNRSPRNSAVESAPWRK